MTASINRPPAEHPEYPRRAATPTPTLADIVAEVETITEQWNQLLPETLGKLRAADVEPRLVSLHKRDTATRGKLAAVVQTFLPSGEPITFIRDADDNPLRWGPWMSRDVLTVNLGDHYVLINDGELALLLPPLDEPSDLDHRRAVARLKTAAAHEGFTVRVVDRSITLTGVGGSSLFFVDVITAFKWLAGLETGTDPEGATAD